MRIDWGDRGFSVTGEGAGLHHNILVTVLRMIVSLHHTPAEARDELERVLGADADALPPRALWSDLIAAIRLEGVEAMDSRVADRVDLERFVADGEIALPSGRVFGDVSTENAASRLVVAPENGGPAIDKAGLARVENDFLGVCNNSGFRELSRLDTMPEEGEFFLRAGDGGMELVIDDYREDAYGLAEFVNAMALGRAGELRIQD